MEPTSIYFLDDYWVSRGNKKLLNYMGPPLKENLPLADVKKFARKKGVLCLMWNYDHDYTKEGPWFRCICDKADYDISQIERKKIRYYIRCGLTKCTIRQVDFQWLADNGYNTYVNAASRYNNFTVETKERFRERMLAYKNVPNSEAFGAFVDENLAAFMTVFIYGDSVLNPRAHFDPAYSDFCPMYALYYWAAKHYLTEKGYKEFDRGERHLAHETNFDEFLLRMGYRKVYCRLGLYMAFPVRLILGIIRVFRKILKAILPNRSYFILESLMLFQDIATATKKIGDAPSIRISARSK
ncbi:MAG: hypothetical protein ABR913_05530 [Sedimentisphaerales bacterium]|jgi:hypothetical protein